MASDENKVLLARVAVGYIRRWMENHVYDSAFDTEWAHSLRGLSNGTMAGLEAALNIATAVVETRLDGEGWFRQILQGVASDFGPEIARRLRDQPARYADAQRWLEVIANLSRHDLEVLLEWVRTVSPDERARMLDELAWLSPDELRDLSGSLPESEDVASDPASARGHSSDDTRLFLAIKAWRGWFANRRNRRAGSS